MRDNTKKEVFSWIKSIFFALMIAFICRQFLFAPVAVQGESMMPTFENNNRLVVSKISEIDHFDVIVFRSPISEKNFIKRVIGLPDDTIEMNNDQLFINGKVYQESYLSQNRKIAEQAGMKKLTGDFGPITVPKDNYFVMGDNRLNSTDSREFGSISNESVVGEVGFRFFPLNEIGTPE
ncbi:signal peptidase I [Bacillus pakistanensis]|uniref:Signal peptidase I n=1 Tax=Rossellomorea pakistanensis TaxID=992288 RepID=A0ABS2NJU1_9BACI|nr:signal peptidase I [Bacillus pakistanensis]MBM7588127.1 signal peptidase I [Bacillus pakistanensis]